MNARRPPRPAELFAAWSLFADWCAGTGRRALPATPQVVADFLAANPAAGSTQARRVAAINAAHDGAGVPSPGREPAVVDLVRALRGRQPRPSRSEVAETAWQAIGRCPTGGWPAGALGRRDAMALLVCRVAGFPVVKARHLTVGDVVDAGGRLTIGGRAVTAGQVPDDEAAGCPRCVWARWRVVLGQVAALASGRVMREALTAAGPAGAGGHVCGAPTRVLPVRPESPLLFAFDQWGAPAVEPEAMSVRALSGLIAAHMAGRPPLRAVSAEPEPEPEPPPAPQPPPPPTAAELRAQHAAALEAKRRDKQIGDDLDVMLTRLEAAAAASEAKIAAVLAADEERTARS